MGHGEYPIANDGSGWLKDVTIHDISHILKLQSKLNCEVLFDDLAFEVRWAVAGESVVVQLVAKLGKLPMICTLKFNSIAQNIHCVARNPRISAILSPFAERVSMAERMRQTLR